MTHDLTWQEKARCAIDDPEILNIFFNDEENGIDYTDAAKEICSECPVRRQCLQFALDTEERFGVWGGSDETTRRWASSIDQYGKPIQRIRDMICPDMMCKSKDLEDVARTKTRTKIHCNNCGLEWWSRKISKITEIRQEDLEDMDGEATTDTF